jgi:signal transduction histidine kinase
MQDLIYAKKDDYYTIQDGDKTIYFINTYPNRYNGYGDEIGDFLIIYKNKVLTNIKLKDNLNTVESIKDYILEENPNNIQYENGIITSNVDIFKDDVYVYNMLKDVSIRYYTIDNEETTVESNEEIEFENNEQMLIESASKEYSTARIEDFTFYTSYTPEFSEGSVYGQIVEIMQILEPYQKAIMIAIPVSAILIIAIIVYLINAIGYNKNRDRVELGDFDKIPLEIIVLIALIVFGISLAIIEELYGSYSYGAYSKIGLFATSIASAYLVDICMFEIICVTIIKRIKAKEFIATSLIGKICKRALGIIKKLFVSIKNTLRNIKRTLSENVSLTVKFVGLSLLYGIFAMAMALIFGPIGFAVDLGILLYVLYEVIRRINSFSKLEKGLQNIYEGNNQIKLDEKDFSPEFKKSVDYVNDISNGFENAVEKSLKSERMKTELITNVSHDIKTPLTSIINYVDLIKKENIDNEKLKEYVEILDNKSQRLKKLTEDLVEAAKATSGNINLNIENIGIVELLNQVIGEYKDKFENKKLEIVSNFPNEEIKIKADSRYIYRVMDNLFGNISKYALENSRVYVDVKSNNEQTILAIKNISKERLNMTEEELMQRFVRGDKSRTTEGNGLGLAIARSLTELQGGKLECKIDGDLFKVEIIFNKN